MATLTGKQLKDSYQGLLTIKTADDANPLSGRLENGLGNAITNLGIGTDSPGYKLEINGSGTVARFTDGTSHMDFYSGSGLNEIATVSPLLLSVGGTERMRITSGGDISFRDSGTNEAFYWDASAGSLGLGTTSPDYNLHIKGDSGQTRLTLEAPANEATVVAFQNTGSATKYLIGYSDSDDAFFFYDDVVNTERMRIDSSGNVGIGTTSPATKFNVVGDTRLNGGINVSGATGESGTQIFSGNTGSVTTAQSVRFAISADRIFESYLCKISIQMGRASSTASNHPAAEYIFRALVNNVGDVSWEGFAPIYEYTLDYTTDVTLTNAGSNVLHVDIANPSGSTLDRNSYKVEVLSNNNVTLTQSVV